jgi:two-component system, LytTR family, response regulator
MRLRSIVVDDEPAARELLLEMLAEYADVEVVGAYGDASEAAAAIRRHRPDLVFLDVEMPRGTGFDLLEAVAERMPAAVVFVTAYGQYAARAFDVDAADYLLKPFDEERLRRAVDRAAARVRGQTLVGPAQEEARLVALLEALQSHEPFARHVPVRVGERIVLQRVDDVGWFEAQGKYVRVHVGRDSHLVRHTMQALERRLDPRRFVRVNRSAIVNVDQVQHAEPWAHGEYVLVLRTGARILSTHTYRAAVQRLLREP